jgi:hypothetical protein
MSDGPIAERERNMANPGSSGTARIGLPAAASILFTRNLERSRTAGAPGTALAPTLRGAYRIMRTDEVDAKDVPLSVDQRNEIAATGVAAATRSSGDSFQGTARKAAKLSIADAPVESFSDVKDIIASLPAKKAMVDHDPLITTDANSDRVTEEQRNIGVDAFIYAMSRENDNDFHVIVGRDPKLQPPMYMTMEVSGLPAQGDASFAQLKKVRDTVKDFFGADLPGASYDFYDPPIPIKVEGSLFFDMSHAHGQSPGPPSLHPDMPVIWEVHPVSDIVFEP